MEITNNERPMYGALPYDMIVDKWNAVYYNGSQPTAADSSTRTYELAMALRNITGNNASLLMKIIPTYEGMSDEMKAQKINAAVSAKQTQMPSRLRDVLNTLYGENVYNKDIKDAIEGMHLDDALIYYNRMPNKLLPMGFRESAKLMGKTCVLQMILFVSALVGGLATNVRLRVDALFNWLNLIVFIIGDSGSNKSGLMTLYHIWVSSLAAEDELLEAKEKEYDRLMKLKKNSKDQPEKPDLPYRLIPVNNTLANVAEGLDNLKSDHAISVGDEIDEINGKWSGGDKVMLSVMLRKAFDAAEFHKRAKSSDAAKCHRKHLKWNVAITGTDDSLMRFMTQYTDGLQSRLALGSMPDNTYLPKTNAVTLKESEVENIKNVARVLRAMSGDLILPKLDKVSDDWTEGIRVEALKNNDEVLARCRMRDHVIAMRIVCCIMLCAVAEKLIKKHGVDAAEEMLKNDKELLQKMMKREQTPAMMETYKVIADYIIDNDLYFFREKLENAYKKSEERIKMGLRVIRGKNDSIYSRLPQMFSHAELVAEARKIKGPDVTDNAIKQIIKNWKASELIVPEGDKFKKLR